MKNWNFVRAMHNLFDSLSRLSALVLCYTCSAAVSRKFKSH